MEIYSGNIQCLYSGNSPIKRHPADMNISGITLSLKGLKWRKIMMLFTCDQNIFPARFKFSEINSTCSLLLCCQINICKNPKVFHSLLSDPAQ